MCQNEDHNSFPNYVHKRPYGSKARKTFAGSSGPRPPASMPLGDLGAPHCAPDMANHDAKQVSGNPIHPRSESHSTKKNEDGQRGGLLGLLHWQSCR